MDKLFTDNMKLYHGSISKHEKKPLTFIAQLPKKQLKIIKHELIKYFYNNNLPYYEISDFMDAKISNIVGISSDYEDLKKVDYICQVFGGYKITAFYDNNEFQYTTYNFGL